MHVEDEANELLYDVEHLWPPQRCRRRLHLQESYTPLLGAAATAGGGVGLHLVVVGIRPPRLAPRPPPIIHLELD